MLVQLLQNHLKKQLYANALILVNVCCFLEPVVEILFVCVVYTLGLSFYKLDIPFLILL